MAAIEPKMGPESYKSYVISRPLATHWREFTREDIRTGKACEAVNCDHYLHGWAVRIEGLPPDLLHMALNSGRKFTIVALAAGESWIHFEPGQWCFKAGTHRVPNEEPALYIVRDGDQRGNPRGTKARQHLRPALWVEDFAEHQDKLADAQQRG